MKTLSLSFLFLLIYIHSACASEINLDKGWQVSPFSYIHSFQDNKTQPLFLSKQNVSSLLWKYKNIQIPSTAMNVVIQSQHKPQEYQSKLLTEAELSKVDKQQFRQPWFFKKEININAKSGQYVLHLKGINYYAKLWINGHEYQYKNVRLHNQLINPFIQYNLNITSAIQSGGNSILLEVIPPFCFHDKVCQRLAFKKKGDYSGDFNIGFVDWSPAAPDYEMGITRPISLSHFPKNVSVTNPYVQTTLLNNNQEADLVLNANVTNFSRLLQKVIVTAYLDGKQVAKTNITLKAHQLKNVSFDSSQFSTLKLHHPKLWWPAQLGTSSLHRLTFNVTNLKNQLLSESDVEVGLREVKTLNERYEEKGKTKSARVFKVNGRPVTIIGSEWVDPIFLNDSHQQIKQKLILAKQMGLNTLRLEGFWGHDAFLYDEADKLGLLLLPGWSCQWEWSYYLNGWTNVTPNVVNTCDPEHGCVQTEDDITLIKTAFRSQVMWLRNHPSILGWMTGSDATPLPKLFDAYQTILAKIDPKHQQIVSAGEVEGVSSVHSGLKMRGPYAYEPPIYWFENTNLGGAFGFASEVNPGAELPEMSSIYEMLPFSHSSWNKQSKTNWDYHAGRGHFFSLDNYYNPAIKNRYGEPKSLYEYGQESQLINYETVRGMFEAYNAYQSKNPHMQGARSTGVIQWQLTSSWPETYWQLFDYYLKPTAAFYGAKEANKMLHGIYDPSTRHVYISNRSGRAYKDIAIDISVYDINSNILYRAKSQILNSKGMSSIQAPNLILPPFNQVHFLNIKISQNNQIIDENTYWLAASDTKDQLDYEQSKWFYTPVKEYANLQALKRIPQVRLSFHCTKNLNDKFQIDVKNEDPHHLAFFIHLRLNQPEPSKSKFALWSENYINLMPGESKQVSLKFNDQEKLPSIFSTAWNVPQQKVECPL
ncbi:hypothetical protein SOPP22_07395 [Shewanella sp. OPT22]|nr:hypothetical protein SOPP22_07395 [Shewanella sp. OPT22]